MLGGPYITAQRSSTTPDIASVSPRYRSRLGVTVGGSGAHSGVSTGGKTHMTSNYKDDYVQQYHDSVASAETARMSGSRGAPASAMMDSSDGVMTDVPLRDFNHNNNNLNNINRNLHDIGKGRPDESLFRVSRRVAYAVLCLAVASGAILATVVIAISKPGCFGREGSGSSSLRPNFEDDDDFETRAPVITEAPTPAPTTSAPTAEPEPLPPAEPGFPETCSNEKIAQVREQLQVYSCYPPIYPWSQKCSFSHVTKGCQGQLYVREFYANLNSTEFNGYPFLGVIIGWEQDDSPVDTLYFGSHNASRYSVPEWNTVIKYTDSCRPLMAVRNEDAPMPAQIMVVEWSDELYRQIREAKKVSGYTDDEFVLDRTDAELDPEDAISNRIAMKFPGNDRPIHYMQIRGRYMDHLILTKSISLDTLNQTRYLSFQYNWKDDWEKEDSTLISLIERLKTAGLTCYWSGNSEHPTDLWRITDCWSWHYESKQWAHVACVNTQHDDVEPLKRRMEMMFEATMQKNQTFGGKPQPGSEEEGDIR